MSRGFKKSDATDGEAMPDQVDKGITEGLEPAGDRIGRRSAHGVLYVESCGEIHRSPTGG